MNQMAPIGTDREAAAAGVARRLKAWTKIAPRRIMTDPLMTYAYAGDASQYRLVPAIVVIVNSEAEVLAVIQAARAERLPLTFRAAGTSLCGQSNTDGVLCVLGDGFKKIEVHDNGERITLGPAVIVAQANRVLKKFNRKLGPDPASQATCKIGGVVNNNSSGMCCGVAYNTYHTLAAHAADADRRHGARFGRSAIGRGVPQDQGRPARGARTRSTTRSPPTPSSWR